MGQIDSTPENLVSAMVSNGHIKFLLLHENKNEEAIKQFFQEVFEIYLKKLLNPFYKPNSFIKCLNFDAKVKQLSKKYLNTSI